MPISSALAVGSGTPDQSASRIVAIAAAGSHTLTLDGYSSIKNESVGNWITSAIFTVGGHSWSAELLYSGPILMLLRHRCAPCSDDEERVQARYTFSILDQNGQPSYSKSSGEVGTFTATNSCGLVQCEARCVFNESRTRTFLKGDCLKIRSDVTVYKEVRTENCDVPVEVPPSDIGEQLGRLLSSGVGADLTFEVGGETIAAHKHILAVRSLVLLEEIVDCGGLTKSVEAANRGIQISGVEARVFRALLHYIYTDSLPEINKGEATDMAQHLMALAKRYGLDRLMLICKHQLCRRVDTSTLVAATLAHAEQ